MFDSFAQSVRKWFPKNQDVEILPLELRSKLDKGEKLTIIDVRDPAEWSAGHLKCAKSVPLSELANRLSKLKREESIVLHCQHGMRSMRALHFLQKHGFTQVKSLKGGLTAWRASVDPDLTHY